MVAANLELVLSPTILHRSVSARREVPDFASKCSARLVNDSQWRGTRTGQWLLRRMKPLRRFSPAGSEARSEQSMSCDTTAVGGLWQR